MICHYYFLSTLNIRLKSTLNPQAGQWQVALQLLDEMDQTLGEASWGVRGRRDSWQVDKNGVV